MGLKSGSRDAGLDDPDDEPDQQDEDANTAAAGEPARDTTTSDRTDSRSTVDDPDREPVMSSDVERDKSDTQDRPTMNSIPYKLRREKVNEGREQVPYFLREAVIDAEDDLQDTLEEILGEDVYKSDYREASMVVAHRNPDLVADVLREWGYDLESS